MFSWNKQELVFFVNPVTVSRQHNLKPTWVTRDLLSRKGLDSPCLHNEVSKNLKMCIKNTKFADLFSNSAYLNSQNLVIKFIEQQDMFRVSFVKGKGKLI